MNRGNGLLLIRFGRQKTNGRPKNNGRPVHEGDDATKNRWRILGTGKGGQRWETRMPSFTTTI